MKAVCGLVFLTLCHCTPALSASLINAWTNPASGNWEDLTWSLGALPGYGQTIMVTNQGWKAVAIGHDTAEHFPETLDVARVILGGYTDSFNTVLLNYAGFQTQLVTRSLIIGTNSAVTALSSKLFVPPGAATPEFSIGGTFNQGESAIVSCGLLDMGVLGPGTYNLTNGNLSVSTGLRFLPGFPSTFNQSAAAMI